MPILSYHHLFEPATDASAPPLLLLHGTGGDEHDLVPLARQLSPGSALLSPRGDVLERGAPRFFRRLAEGVFDHADVERRTHALANFVAAAAREYGFDAARLTAFGFSNGANIAAALLLLRPESLAAAAVPPSRCAPTPRATVSSRATSAPRRISCAADFPGGRAGPSARHERASAIRLLDSISHVLVEQWDLPDHPKSRGTRLPSEREPRPPAPRRISCTADVPGGRAGPSTRHERTSAIRLSDSISHVLVGQWDLPDHLHPGCGGWRNRPAPHVAAKPR